jgi:predicted nucleic acid-binding protein
MIVLDASVAAKWFILERDSDKAKRVLDAVQESPDTFAVPELFFVEMLNVLARTDPSTERVRQYMSDLEELGLTRLAHGHDLVSAAAALACDRGLSGYDAIYAATAQMLKGTWLTADDKAHRKIAPLRISKLL